MANAETTAHPARPAYQLSEERIARELAEQHAQIERYLRTVTELTAITGEPTDA